MIDFSHYQHGDAYVFDLEANGDGFQVSKEELLEFMVRAAKELGLPSLGCVDCGAVPKWISVPTLPQHGANLVCQKHRELWDAEQPTILGPIEWKKI